MAHVQQSIALGVDAESVWKLIGSFDKMNEWHPAILTSESEDTGSGHLRHLSLLGGTKKMTESLDTLDADGMNYTFTTIDGPLPVTDFHGSVSVKSTEEGCEVHVSATFDPMNASEADSIAVIEGYFSTGLSALKKKFS